MPENSSAETVKKPLATMIFKSCTWPSEVKDENGTAITGTAANKTADRKIADVLLRCCPCVFRCRKSVGIDRDKSDEDEKGSISTIITTATPVIAFRLNRNSDTVDKASLVKSEEEYNTRNKRHFSFEKNYHKQNSNNEEFRYQEFLRSFSVGRRARERSRSASSSSSDISKSDQQDTENQDTASQNYHDNNNSGSSTSRSQDVDDPAFDVIMQQATNRQNIRDDVDSFFMDYSIEMTNAPTAKEIPEEWSEDNMKSTARIGSISRHSNHEELITIDENCNRDRISSSGMPEQPKDDGLNATRKSIVSVISNERSSSYEDSKTFKESLQTKAGSPKKLESLYQSPSHAHHSSISNLSSKKTSCCSSRDLEDDIRDSSEERIVASIVLNEDTSIQSLDAINHSPIDIGITDDSPAIIIASRLHSHETVKYIEDSRNENTNSHNKINIHESTEEESSANDTLEERQSKDSASETNTEPGILKIESQSTEIIEVRKRTLSKVPSRGIGKCRSVNPNPKKIMDKPLEKSNRMVQQCFVQLENKDWEITIKGLKALSQISKQHPEYLDTCATGMIGRLLGRHIKNLRSQVARAACLAASDIFSSQIRGIDQDLDDIAGPLLHRTADTNRFLRTDSNAALDQMIQHLPPHKTICVIILRGASHQNAIVRAATARLLSDIVDRIGPDHVMILPRDVKDKLLNTGAKLLMDGNLDARNHTKRLFRRLTGCEGFRRALTDAVPETTLRHIDKTMKTL